MFGEIWKEALNSETLDDFIENKDKKYLFAFLDILGYSNKIKVKAAEDYLESFIVDVMALQEDYVPQALNRVRNKDGLVAQVKTMIFSDSFCLYWEIGDYADNEENISENEFQQLFEDVVDFVCDIQCSALNNNILFRGAFSVGRHYMYKNVTVSEALVKAHDIESYHIKYPRIGLDTRQENEFLNNPDFIVKLIKENRMKKEDSILYIDYLQLFRRISTWHPYNKIAECLIIENNKKCYLENINLISNDKTIDEEKKKHILDKYRWLRKYHNMKCNELGYSNLLLEETIE
jgi:hypothetical protein